MQKRYRLLLLFLSIFTAALGDILLTAAAYQLVLPVSILTVFAFPVAAIFGFPVAALVPVIVKLFLDYALATTGYTWSLVLMQLPVLLVFSLLCSSGWIRKAALIVWLIPALSLIDAALHTLVTFFFLHTRAVLFSKELFQTMELWLGSSMLVSFFVFIYSSFVRITVALLLSFSLYHQVEKLLKKNNPLI